MTIILPAGSRVYASRDAAPVSANPAEAKSSFADFLDSPLSQEQQRENIFSFGELGMFGRYGAQPLSTSNKAQIGDGMLSEVMLLSGESSLPPVSAMRDPTLRQSYRADGGGGLQRAGALAPGANAGAWPQQQSAMSNPIDVQSLIGNETQESSLSDELGSSAETGASSLSISDEMPFREAQILLAREVKEGGVLPSAQSDQNPAEDVEPAFTDVGSTPISTSGSDTIRSKVPAPADNTANAVNLVVSGSNDALMIVVRNTSGSGEEYAGLHQLMKDTAAGFGMDVADFQLNGSPPGRSFSTFVGGKNGSRPR